MTPSSRQCRSAFTLVEMLVSIGVLVLIMTFIGQMMSSVSQSTSLSAKHIDADNQARLVFDRMAMDFAGMPHRNDVEFIFAKENGQPGSVTPDPSDKMFFYSQAPALFDTSNDRLYPPAGVTQADPKSDYGLIGFCINTGSNNTGSLVPPTPYCLERLSKGLTWDAQYPSLTGPGGLMFLTFNPGYQSSGYMTALAGSTLAGNAFTSPALGTPPDYSGTDSAFQTLANQVFRLEFCFQVKNLSPGAVGTVFANYPVAVYSGSDSQYNNTFAARITTDAPVLPGATGVNSSGQSEPIHVGDRWYNPTDNLAVVCTGTSSSAITWAPNGLSDVTAIVVAIAVLDTNSRKTLSTQDIATAASYLPDFADPPKGDDPSPNPSLMQTTWEDAINAQPTTFASTAGIPQAGAAQIRVYQRFFYLNNN